MYVCLCASFIFAEWIRACMWVSMGVFWFDSFGLYHLIFWWIFFFRGGVLHVSFVFLTAIDYCLFVRMLSDSVGCSNAAATDDDGDGSVFCRKNDDIHNMAETISLRFTICSISYCVLLFAAGDFYKNMCSFFQFGFSLV